MFFDGVISTGKVNMAFDRKKKVQEYTQTTQSSFSILYTYVDNGLDICLRERETVG